MAADFVWAKALSVVGTEAGMSCLPQATTVDVAGNHYVVGTFGGTVDFDPGDGTANLTSSQSLSNEPFVAKYDAAGNYLWAVSFGGFHVDDAHVNDVAVDSAGSVYIAGAFKGSVDFDPDIVQTATLSSRGMYDAFVVKLDSGGRLVWASQFGDWENDEAHLTVDAASNVVIAGRFRGTVDFDPGPGAATLTSDIGSLNSFVLKLDSDGNFDWVKSFAGGYNEARGVAIDPAGNIVVTGQFGWGAVDFDPESGVETLTSAGDADVYLVKLSSNGHFIWVRQLAGPDSSGSTGIDVDSAGSVVVGGVFFGTVNFNPSGSAAMLTTHGGQDGFLVKFAADGGYRWAHQIGGVNDDAIFGVKTDALDNVLVAGYFDGTVDFDPGPGETSFTSNHFDIFATKFTSSGSHAWTKRFGNSGYEHATAVATRGGEATIVGYFHGTIDFDPGPGVFNVTGSSAGFLLKLSDGNTAPRHELRNAAGEIVTGAAVLTLDENAAPATLVGTLTAFDIDAVAGLTITMSDPSGTFAFDAGTGRITVRDPAKLNFEKTKNFATTFVIDDVAPAGTTPKSVRLTVKIVVRDVNEKPVVDATAAYAIAENNRAGAIVGAVRATDPDRTAPNKTLNYSIVGVQDLSGATVAPVPFAIDARGRITVNAARALDFEANPRYTLTVRVTDGGGLFADQIVTVNVLDVNDPVVPTLLDVGNNPVVDLAVSENTATGTLVGRLHIANPDHFLETFGIAFRTSWPRALTLAPFNAATNTVDIVVADGTRMDFESIRGGTFTLTVTVSDSGFVNAAGKRLPKTVVTATYTVRVLDVAETSAS